MADGDVPWAVGSAWAPCIAEKDGKYYYYFCGKRVDGKSCIGAAVSDYPEGTFVPAAEPMITMEMMETYQIQMSQTIDPSIYQENGETYLLFGNGYAAIAKLTPDMMHIVGDDENLEGLYDFREAVTVLKRDEIYHFTWSCDDTGSENYHVTMERPIPCTDRFGLKRRFFRKMCKKVFLERVITASVRCLEKMHTGLLTIVLAHRLRSIRRERDSTGKPAWPRWSLTKPEK